MSAIGIKTNSFVPRDYRKNEGFTLVEMMAVLVIISLISAAVILAAPARIDDVQDQGEKLHREFVLAAERSVITGVPQAFGISEDGFLFYAFENGEWEVLSEDVWPDDVNVEFFKDEVEIELPKEPIPVVVFEPVGLSTYFDLYLEGDENMVVFSSDGNGRVSWETIE